MSNEAKRHKRLLAGVLAGAMALTVTPILGFTGTAGALEDPTSDGQVCEDAPEADFTDTDEESAETGQAIECLAGTAITVGTGDGTTFEPGTTISRRQMALFLVRLADVLDANDAGDNITALPAGDGATAFTDIPAERDEVQSAVDRLHEAGVTQGTTATTFSPGDPVTREQMAAFVVRLQRFVAGEDAPAAGTDDAFSDDDDSFAEEEFNILAEEGVFVGFGDGTVDPGAPMTRRQMANVMIRKAQWHFEEGDITRLFDEDDQGDADFSADPRDTQLLAMNTTTGITQQEITFSELGTVTSVDVGLVPCGLVVDDGSAVSLVDDFDGDGEFDTTDEGTEDYWDGEDDSSITEINGTDTNVNFQDSVTVVNGQVEIQVENDDFESDCVYVFVWQDTEDDDAIELDDMNQPSEPFGVSGPIVWHNGEAPNGVGPNGPESGHVLYVDKTDQNNHSGFFVTDDGYQYFYGTGDTYSMSENFNVTLEQFESALSIFDYVQYDDVDQYSRTAQNEFDIYEDYGYSFLDGAGIPTNVVATAGDFDTDAADTGANDVTVTFDAPAEGIVAQLYCVDAYDTMGTATRNDDSQVTSECGEDAPGVDDEDGSDRSIVFEDLAQDTYIFYAYVAESVTWDENDGFGPYSLPSAVTTVAAAAVGSPISTSATFQDVDSNGLISPTDILTVTYDQAMAAPAAGANFTVTDADGTVTTVICGSNATCATADLSGTVAGNESLTFTMTAAPQTSQAGTVAGAQYGSSTVVSSSGILDTDGQSWDLPNSTDTTF